MPKTAALAVASSRGFGQFTSGAFALTTVTFTSSTTWTAPAYLTNILTMTGYGTNASSDSYPPETALTTIYRAQREIFSGGSSTTHDWSEIYNNLQAWISFINTGTPGVRSAGSIDGFISKAYSINSDNTYNFFQTPQSPGYGSSNTYFVVGTGSNQSLFSVPSSGTITYANTPTSGSNNVRIGFSPVYLGGNGSAATGVGKTFPGGTYDFATGIGGSAPTTNFSNVAVTPGTNYSIVVPSGASISISYYAPA